MRKLVIVKKEDNEYTLKDLASGDVYKLEITFFDLDENPDVGDVIAMHKEQLDPSYIEYTKEFYFGGLDKPYGRAVKDKDHLDFIAVNVKGKKTGLKRFFG